MFFPTVTSPFYNNTKIIQMIKYRKGNINAVTKIKISLF